MWVHHTEGRRQQLGLAKLHRDPQCPHLRKGMGRYSEDIPEESLHPRQLCQRCERRAGAATPGLSVGE